MIEWRERGDDWFLFAGKNKQPVAHLYYIKNDCYKIEFYVGQELVVHGPIPFDQAKAKAEELLTEWLTTAIKDLPEDKLAELNLRRLPEIIARNCGRCLSTYPPDETCPNGCK